MESKGLHFGMFACVNGFLKHRVSYGCAPGHTLSMASANDSMLGSKEDDGGGHCGRPTSKHTMIQVELKPEVEARLVADALANGVEPAVYAGAVIERAYQPGNGSRKASRSPQEVRAWLDSLAQFSDKIPQLPEEAFKRESFYQENE